jgi:hypothetical protein
LPPEKPFVPSNRWALVIGASAYSDEVGRLRFTAKEAREFSDELQSRLGFEPANIRLLTDGSTPQEAPTSAHILAALDSLLNDRRLDKANLFVFYFSGHGIGTPRGDFLLPSDVDKDRLEAMGVPVKKVIERIVNAGLKNVLFIADACRSGTQNQFGEELSALCHKANIAVILGCAPGKRSYEYPQLKQGAFTHFLIEDLKRPDLRDGAGVLWASRLGKALQGQVHDFTEPDHGSYAQTPALWAEQSTLDVLLAVYPGQLAAGSLQSFQDRASGLNKANFCVALTVYAASLQSAERDDDAVKLLQTVDGLGELTPEGRYRLAVSLEKTGRAGEAERVYRSFADATPGFWRDVAVSQSSSRETDPKLRLQTAFQIFDNAPVWDGKLIGWWTIALWGSYEQKLHYARSFAGFPERAPRKREYALGIKAFMEGRCADAIQALRKSLKSPGDMPDDRSIWLEELECATTLGDPGTMEKVLSERPPDDLAIDFVNLQRAQLAKDQGDTTARLALLKRALRPELSPRLMLWALKVAGPYIGKLQNEFRAVAKGHPYSWEARLTLVLLGAVSGEGTSGDEDSSALVRYVGDPLTFYAALFDYKEAFFREAVELNRMTPFAYQREIDRYYLILRSFVKDFGNDDRLWLQLALYGLAAEREAQVDQTVLRYLHLTPASTPRGYRRMMMVLAANRGDDAAMQTLSHLPAEPQEKKDGLWYSAFYDAMRGRTAQASQRVKTLAPPSPELRSSAEALKTYLLAKEGRSAEARQRLKGSSNNPVVQALNGLTWAQLGDWKRAEPLLTPQTAKKISDYVFVQQCALRTLDERYRKTGRAAEARTLAWVASSSEPGNPLFDTFTFAAKPGLAQFAGTVELNCIIEDDVLSFKSLMEEEKKTYAFGKLTLQVSPVGELAGSFTDGLGGEYPFRGTVDARGNVRGHAEWRGRSLSLRAKIAPPQLYKTYPSFKTLGQMLQFVDADGYRIAVIGRTDPLPVTPPRTAPASP